MLWKGLLRLRASHLGGDDAEEADNFRFFYKRSIHCCYSTLLLLAAVGKLLLYLFLQRRELVGSVSEQVMLLARLILFSSKCLCERTRPSLAYLRPVRQE